MGLPGDLGACAYYRVLQPLNAIHQLGLADVAIPPIVGSARRVRLGGLKDEEERRLMHDYGPTAGRRLILDFYALTNVLDYDVVVLQRQETPEIERMATAIRESGRTVVFDMDDDAVHIPDWNPNYLMWGKDKRKVAMQYARAAELKLVVPDKSPAEIAEDVRERRKQLFRNMKIATLLSVSTPQLQRTYSSLNSNIAVLPNQMNPHDWEGVEPYEHPGEFWFVWAGSKTHMRDLEQLRPMKTALMEHPGARLVICGFPEAQQFMFGGWPEELIKTFPWASMEEYKRYIASADVVLAPSLEHPFNEAKSDIRVLEAWLCKKPVLVSETTYGGSVRLTQGGFVVKRQREWDLWTRRLLEMSQADRDACGQRGYDYVVAKRTYLVNAERWFKAYERAVNYAN